MSKKLGCLMAGLSLLGAGYFVIDKDAPQTVAENVPAYAAESNTPIAAQPESVVAKATALDRVLLGRLFDSFVSDSFRAVREEVANDMRLFDRSVNELTMDEAYEFAKWYDGLDRSLELGRLDMLPDTDVGNRHDFWPVIYTAGRIDVDRFAGQFGFSAGCAPVLVFDEDIHVDFYRQLDIVPSDAVLPRHLGSFVAFLKGLGADDVFEFVDSYSLKYVASADFAFPKRLRHFESGFNYSGRDPLGDVIGRELVVLDSSFYDSVDSAFAHHEGAVLVPVTQDLRLFDVAFAYVRNRVRPLTVGWINAHGDESRAVAREAVFAYECANKLISKYIVERARGEFQRSQSDLSHDRLFGYAYIPSLENQYEARSIDRLADLDATYLRFLR